MTTKLAIVGSGNIGTDLLIKCLHGYPRLQPVALVGIDPESDGLARARGLGVATTDKGVAGLIAMPEFDGVDIVLDATSAKAHIANAAALEPYGKQLLDLTPAAIGPYVVPVINLDQHLGAKNLNMVTCGGQATIPIVHAISRITSVPYAEIVASIASRSAGPGTRANVDEFTETTSKAIEQVGGARRGKAVIILNPAEPPMLMRDTVMAIVEEPRRDEIVASIEQMVAEVARYVPGYRLKQDVQFSPIPAEEPLRTLIDAAPRDRWKVSVFLEVEGAAHYLPAYAGNLDIMTSAALEVANRLAEGTDKMSGVA
ncbi:acetaldehyde dehydrogenase [Mycolicibacterium wolinskyi]|uniref:Acetaldehyde dehydrogenase n=1 Tax=Mycolicibacterium wolinskyi TaxID=59750 RepID=A0A132PSN1_9MYCO|nr:acetaldehyde dehydrogenase (acetylating) [Mycolicibacterium wolinskyi]KWX25333.1 acetaldehyde dehydrogenase [Mycolicibacterium wolinskyi]